MNRRLFPFAELTAVAAVLAGGYVIVATARATSMPPLAVSDQSDRIPTAKEAASSAPLPTPTLAPARKVTSAKPPVPLRTVRHATYWDRQPPSATKEVKEDRQPPSATKEASVTEQTKKTTEVSVTEPTNKKMTSDTSAKAMIEADGYKNVRALVKAADGLWRGRAMRGNVEIAVAVDANGSVTAQ